MTKTTRWMVVALVAAGGVAASRGCAGRGSRDRADPDDKLAVQLHEVLCGVGKVGAKDPVKGVRMLGAYLADHTGDMLKNLGDTITMIERIEDDDKHDLRALRARTTWGKVVARCEKPWREFGEAVEDSEEAPAILAATAQRVNRTLEIIFGERTPVDPRSAGGGDPAGSAGGTGGGAPRRIDLRTLPAELSRALSKLR